MVQSPHTVIERVHSSFGRLTRAERRAAEALMRNYPMSALGSITTLAQAAEVSIPTIARLVQKIGFRGYQEFQGALRTELGEQLAGPLVRHARWSSDAPQAHILNRFADAALENLRRTLADLDAAAFDAACELLADGRRRIFGIGGRITYSLADYFCTHLSMLRDGVVAVPANEARWAQTVLSMRSGDVLVLFDIRRYQPDLLKLAAVAARRGVTLVLFSDQWNSPLAPLAAHRFSCRVEVPSAWDSVAAIVVVLETLIAGVQERTWPSTSSRMQELETLYRELHLFR